MNQRLTQCFIGSLMLLFQTPTLLATPILVTDLTGQTLLGANNVEVNGALYNVRFRDGDCIGVFNGCDAPEDFTFTTLADAEAASQSLIVQLFNTGGAAGDGIFDYQPHLTLGCEFGRNLCSMVTPWANYVPPGAPRPGAITESVFVGIAHNYANVSPFFDADFWEGLPTLQDLSLLEGVNEDSTWALWTLADAGDGSGGGDNPSTVPEPSSLALLAIGLLNIFLLARRNKRV